MDKYWKFLIGTMSKPRYSDSHYARGKWCVNCVNMWKATLGKRLNSQNAVFEHQIIVLHEITHWASEEMNCLGGTEKCPWDEGSWDRFFRKILSEFS